MRAATHMKHWIAALALAGLSGQAAAQAQAASDAWQFDASIYVYLPSIDSQSIYPIHTDGSTASVSGEQIFDALNFAFMGALDAHKGKWGVWNDFVYVNFSGDKSATRDFTLGNTSIDASATADLGLKIKGMAWTLAGEYRFAATPTHTADVLVGTRLFDLQETLTWGFNGNLGSFAGARQGSTTLKEQLWDVIVGVKGRMAFGDRLQWYVPYYFDIGTGDSACTVQAAAGIGYAYKWGSINALYRYLDYDMKSGNAIESFSFSGPQFGVTFRF